MNHFDKEWLEFSASLAGSRERDIFPLGEIGDAAAKSVLAQTRRELVGATSMKLLRQLGGVVELAIEPAVYGDFHKDRAKRIAELIKLAETTAADNRRS